MALLLFSCLYGGILESMSHRTMSCTHPSREPMMVRRFGGHICTGLLEFPKICYQTKTVGSSKNNLPILSIIIILIIIILLIIIIIIIIIIITVIIIIIMIIIIESFSTTHESIQELILLYGGYKDSEPGACKVLRLTQFHVKPCFCKEN